jgi:hypothetical protein
MASLSSEPSNRTARRRTLRKISQKHQQQLQQHQLPPLPQPTLELEDSCRSLVHQPHPAPGICLVPEEIVTLDVSEMSGILDCVRVLVWHRAENSYNTDKHDLFFECFYGKGLRWDTYDNHVVDCQKCGLALSYSFGDGDICTCEMSENEGFDEDADSGDPDNVDYEYDGMLDGYSINQDSQLDVPSGLGLGLVSNWPHDRCRSPHAFYIDEDLFDRGDGDDGPMDAGKQFQHPKFGDSLGASLGVVDYVEDGSLDDESKHQGAHLDVPSGLLDLPHDRHRSSHACHNDDDLFDGVGGSIDFGILNQETNFGACSGASSGSGSQQNDDRSVSVHDLLRMCYRECPSALLKAQEWDDLQFYVCKSLAASLWELLPSVRDSPAETGRLLEPTLNVVWRQCEHMWRSFADEGIQGDTCMSFLDAVESCDFKTSELLRPGAQVSVLVSCHCLGHVSCHLCM